MYLQNYRKSYKFGINHPDVVLLRYRTLCTQITNAFSLIQFFAYQDSQRGRSAKRYGFCIVTSFTSSTIINLHMHGFQGLPFFESYMTFLQLYQYFVLERQPRSPPDSFTLHSKYYLFWFFAVVLHSRINRRYCRNQF